MASSPHHQSSTDAESGPALPCIEGPPLPGSRLRAGCVVVRYDRNTSYREVLLISSMGSRPGQYVLPSGKIEASDEDEKFSALRETEEEAGLRCKIVQDLGWFRSVSKHGEPVATRFFLATPEEELATFMEQGQRERRWASLSSGEAEQLLSERDHYRLAVKCAAQVLGDCGSMDESYSDSSEENSKRSRMGSSVESVASGERGDEAGEAPEHDEGGEEEGELKKIVSEGFAEVSQGLQSSKSRSRSGLSSSNAPLAQLRNGSSWAHGIDGGVGRGKGKNGSHPGNRVSRGPTSGYLSHHSLKSVNSLPPGLNAFPGDSSGLSGVTPPHGGTCSGPAGCVESEMGEAETVSVMQVLRLPSTDMQQDEDEPKGPSSHPEGKPSSAEALGVLSGQEDLIVYGHQVGGHTCFVKLPNSEIILKPFDEDEFCFYRQLLMTAEGGEEKVQRERSISLATLGDLPGKGGGGGKRGDRYMDPSLLRLLLPFTAKCFGEVDMSRHRIPIVCDKEGEKGKGKEKEKDLAHSSSVNLSGKGDVLVDREPKKSRCVSRVSASIELGGGPGGPAGAGAGVSPLPTPLGSPLMASKNSSRLHRKYVILEDLTYNMALPCILDVKMGVKQRSVWHTSAVKRERTARKSRQTTSHSLGFRLCGVQFYDPETGERLFFDKYYGRRQSREGAYALIENFCRVSKEETINRALLKKYSGKLKALGEVISQLRGFRFWCGSLLFVYDASVAVRMEEEGRGEEEIGEAVAKSARVKMIDFAQTRQISPSLSPSSAHLIDLEYSCGLSNLTRYLEGLEKGTPFERVEEALEVPQGPQMQDLELDALVSAHTVYGPFRTQAAHSPHH